MRNQGSLPAAVAVMLLAGALTGAALAQEAIGLQGGGDPATAPSVMTGRYVDTIRQPETLWYAVQARAGQAVSAVVVVRAPQGGPSSDSTELRAQVLDAQRQPVGPAVTAHFSGRADAQVEVAGARLPPVSAGAGHPYLTVSLVEPGGGVPLADFAYALEFSLAVEGEPTTPSPSAAPTPSPPASPSPSTPMPTNVQTAPAAPQPARDGAVVGDVLPVAIIAFALGGAAGFELTRRRR